MESLSHSHPNVWESWRLWISTFDLIKRLGRTGAVRISEHGWDELEADDILVRDVVDGLSSAVVLEDYPEFGKGPSVLVLEYNRESEPIHVVWGIPKGHDSPAVLVTAYRPDPSKWENDFKRRKP